MMKFSLIILISIFLNVNEVCACASIPEVFKTGLKGLDKDMSFTTQCDGLAAKLTIKNGKNLRVEYGLKNNRICLKASSSKMYNEREKISRNITNAVQVIDKSSIEVMKNGYEKVFNNPQNKGVYSGAALSDLNQCLSDFPFPESKSGQDCAKNDFVKVYNDFFSLDKMLSNILPVDWDKKIKDDLAMLNLCKKVYDMDSYCDGTLRELKSLGEQYKQGVFGDRPYDFIDAFYAKYAPYGASNYSKACSEFISNCAIKFRNPPSLEQEESSEICSDYSEAITLEGKAFRPTDIRDTEGNVVGSIIVGKDNILTLQEAGSVANSVKFIFQENKLEVKVQENGIEKGSLVYDNANICQNQSRSGSVSKGQHIISGSNAAFKVESGKCGPSLQTESLNANSGSGEKIEFPSGFSGVR